MKRFMLLALAVQLGLTFPVMAGLFSHSEPAKPAPAPAPSVPAHSVPELIEVLKKGPNEKDREAAAVELGQYSPKDAPEIVPALIYAMEHDAKSEVRSEAVTSVGKMRPISKEVGEALELVSDKDGSFSVRWHAQRVLWAYEHDGYDKMEKVPPYMRNPHPGGGYNVSQ